MNFEPIQQSIVDQLGAAFTASSLTCQAKMLPDSEAEYNKAVQNPIAFVAYTGSTSPGVRNTNPVAQDRKAQFQVECFARKLYGNDGLNKMCDAIELALIGFRPLNCDRMYLVKDDLDRGKDTIWARIIQFECATMLIQSDLSDTVVTASLTTVIAKFENVGAGGDDQNGQLDTIIPEPS